jgi:hypothetical protein
MKFVDGAPRLEKVPAAPHSCTYPRVYLSRPNNILDTFGLYAEYTFLSRVSPFKIGYFLYKKIGGSAFIEDS